MKKTFLISFLSAFLALSLIPAQRVSAQRTASGEFLTGASVGYPFSPSFGAEADFGRYSSVGFWRTSVRFIGHGMQVPDTGSRFSYAHVIGEYAYMFRLYRTFDSRWNVYLGSGAFLGFELLDPFSMLPSGETIVSSGEAVPSSLFTYGFSPAVQAEWFFLPVVALTGSFTLDIPIASSFSHVRPLLSVGLRYNFSFL